jgi:Uma2 family endonuclease
MPAVRKHRWTLEEVERLIDQRDGATPRYELVDGALLVTPAPSGRHQRIAFRLAVLLDVYVRQHGLGEVRLGPGAVELDDETHFEPDIFVIPLVNGRLPRANDPVTDLLLAVEVLSPGSGRHDRITKRRFFLQHDVPDYWVVDGDAEAFEVWHPRDERAALIDDTLSWHPAGASEAFVLDIRRFFAGVADEAGPVTEA